MFSDLLMNVIALPFKQLVDIYDKQYKPILPSLLPIYSNPMERRLE